VGTHVYLTTLHPSAQQASRRQLRRATRAWLEAFHVPTGGEADEEMLALETFLEPTGGDADEEMPALEAFLEPTGGDANEEMPALEAFLEPTGGDADDEPWRRSSNLQQATQMRRCQPWWQTSSLTSRLQPKSRTMKTKAPNHPFLRAGRKRWIGWSRNNDPSNWTS